MQYDAGEGPCLSSARSGRVVRLHTLADPDFPAFAAAARQRGVLSSLSLPVARENADADGTTGAALNIYGSTATAFAAARPRAIGDLLVRCARRVLVDRPAEGNDSPANAVARAEQLRDVVIEAQCLVARDHGLSMEQAYRWLARQSSDESASIVDVAAGILAHARDA